jgi:PAS domain-containing protein
MPQASKPVYLSHIKFFHRLRRSNATPVSTDTGPSSALTPTEASSFPLLRYPYNLLALILTYLLLGLIWVLLSNALLQIMTEDADSYRNLQTAKDMLSLGLSALLFTLIAGRSKRRAHAMELQYGALMERSLEGICLVHNGMILQANPALLRLLDCTDEQHLVKTAVLDLFAPDERTRLHDRYQNLREEDDETIDTVLLNGAQQTIPVHLSISRLWVDNHKLDLFLINPIHNGQPQQDLEFEHGFLLNLFDGLPWPLLARTQRGNLQLCNLAMRRHLGMPTQALPFDHVGLPYGHVDSSSLMSALELIERQPADGSKRLEAMHGCMALNKTAVIHAQRLVDSEGDMLGSMLWMSTTPDETQLMHKAQAHCTHLQIMVDCYEMANRYPGLDAMARKLLTSMAQLPWAGDWMALVVIAAAKEHNMTLFQWQRGTSSISSEVHVLQAVPNLAATHHIACYDVDHLNCATIPRALRDALRAAAVDSYVQLPIQVDKHHCAAILIAQPQAADFSLIYEPLHALQTPLQHLFGKVWQDDPRALPRQHA